MIDLKIYYLLTIISYVLIICVTVFAQEDLLPCSERPFVADLPRVEPTLWCIERPIYVPADGELAFTAIEFASDGTLFATRPLTGELYMMRDSDADGLPDNPQLVADGMNLPNGLVFVDSALFIIGDGHIYRYVDEELETLVDDLPGGRGFVASGITYANDWLYVGIPMPCDFCESDNQQHGTIIRMRLDGSERKVLATGLRYPAGLTVWEEQLWVTDTIRDSGRNVLAGDEINLIDLQNDNVPHFGFPYCEGLNNVPTMESDFDCSTVAMPELSLYSQSTPLAIQPYTGDAFVFLKDALLLVLGGSSDNSDIVGYQLVYAQRQIEDNQWILESALPADRSIAGRDRILYSSDRGYTPLYAQRLNLRGAGVWPHRIFDISISSEGWIFFSVGGGQIFSLRPQ